VPDVVYQLDGGHCFHQREAVAGEDLTVAFGVEVGESVAEFDLLAIHLQQPVGSFSGSPDGCGQRLLVDAEEIADPCLRKLQETGDPVVGGDMNNVLLQFAKDPPQHVVKVDTDVGGDASALRNLPLPAGIVPVTAGGDIGEVEVVDFIFWPSIDSQFKVNKRRMQP